MQILEICSCTQLDTHCRPVQVKTWFSPFDEQIVVWCEITNIIAPTTIRMEWYNPENRRVCTIAIPVEPTNKSRPSRYCWSAVKFALIQSIDGKKYGKWTVKVIPPGVSHSFTVSDLRLYNKSPFAPGPYIVDIRL